MNIMKLLLAEDERELSRATAVILEHQGYEVDTAYDGAEALEYILAEQYDGIVLDIMMPKMDGIEVLKKAREHGVVTPILMLTAKAETDDKITGLDSGANDYLTKPFVMNELLARLRAMIRSNSQLIPNMIQMGKTLLSRESLELSGISSSVRLSLNEFKLMEMMMENPERSIASGQILERVWGKEENPDGDVVWVYISYLRNKLNSINADVEITGDAGGEYVLREKNAPHIQSFE